jgi:hypothetical protein
VIFSFGGRVGRNKAQGVNVPKLFAAKTGERKITTTKMYCPQCGNESADGLQYCRNCGANLKVIGRAVALSEAIARSDRGPLPKIKEMVKSLKVEHVTEEVSRAMEKMNLEIAKISPEQRRRKHGGPWIQFGKKKTAEERREEKITKGIISMFSGVGLMVFLYYLSAALVLRIPPDALAKIPFELDPVVRMIWLFGLVPTLSGVGHILAGLTIRPRRLERVDPVSFPEETARSIEVGGSTPPLPEASRSMNPAEPTRRVNPGAPGSVTERTTNLLDHDGYSDTPSRV